MSKRSITSVIIIGISCLSMFCVMWSASSLEAFLQHRQLIRIHNGLLTPLGIILTRRHDRVLTVENRYKRSMFEVQDH
ncbi:hypothetical protein CPB85DRAFT_295801 [Mucidula mucida]|nr:hypothetical protein CPB85DRAFT_295801 [Mucidula mucida]